MKIHMHSLLGVSEIIVNSWLITLESLELLFFFWLSQVCLASIFKMFLTFKSKALMFIVKTGALYRYYDNIYNLKEYKKIVCLYGR